MLLHLELPHAIKECVKMRISFQLKFYSDIFRNKSKLTIGLTVSSSFQASMTHYLQSCFLQLPDQILTLMGWEMPDPNFIITKPLLSDRHSQELQRKQKCQVRKISYILYIRDAMVKYRNIQYALMDTNILFLYYCILFIFCKFSFYTYVYTI